jgi:hypothetical protein
MLNIRNPLTSREEGTMDRVVNSARDTVTSKPFIWGAASLGFGALAGGLITMWRRGGMDGQINLNFARKIMPARTNSKKSMRATTAIDATASLAPKRKARKSKRSRSSANT